MSLRTVELGKGVLYGPYPEPVEAVFLELVEGPLKAVPKPIDDDFLMSLAQTHVKKV